MSSQQESTMVGNETVEAEGMAGAMGADDISTGLHEEVSALRAWFEPYIEPVILAQLQAQGALTVDAVATIEPEDLQEMGMQKFKARGLVAKIRHVWGRQGRQAQHGTTTDSRDSEMSEAEERVAQMQAQLMEAQLSMQVFMQEQERARQEEAARVRQSCRFAYPLFE